MLQLDENGQYEIIDPLILRKQETTLKEIKEKQLIRCQVNKQMLKGLALFNVAIANNLVIIKEPTKED